MRAVQGAAIAAALLVAAVVCAQLAFARPQVTASPVPTATATPDRRHVAVGADASWPSCTPPHGTTRLLPLAAAPAFVVIGVNDGLPGTTSACIAREHAWADTATGGSTAPRLAYYAMAADPWTKAELRWVRHPAWPSSNTVDGVRIPVPGEFASTTSGTTCAGGHAERACAYVFGWATARTDAAIAGLRAPAARRWWIDVESIRTWSRDTRFNQAVVEGMLAGFTASPVRGGVGATAGIYSTPGEWALITGALRPGSPLDATDQWLAVGSVGRARAVALLRRGRGLTPGGRLRMVQYLDGAVDRDVAVPPDR